MKYIIITLLFSTFSFANYIDDNVKKLDWNGIEVVWLEDNSLPTYDVTVYFNEGSLGETAQLAGVGEFMFQQLTSGTTRYTQKVP